ncbi:MAG TPA: DUF402 domain-containing protein [Mycobacteriales bacterium]|nr:DUF402 domain-containing protein [Mycobacteriales bacterium]
MLVEDSASVRASGEPPYWRPGDVVNWRYRRPSQRPLPESVVPVTVVRDDASGLVAWVAEGTPVWTVVRADGRGLREVGLAERFYGERAQTQGEWQGPGVLRVAPTGASWSVWHFRHADGSHRGWYVNLERPHVRDAQNVYTQDYILDLWVTPDRTVIRKDEDELVAAARAGRFTPDEVDHIWQVAALAEEAVRQWAQPFCDGWENWMPNEDWPVPPLPSL